MSCNCGQPTQCNNCATGVSCGCPPDWAMLPLPPDCGCCPDGYTWSGATPNWPNGVCTDSVGTTTDPIDCEQCEESVSDSCVFLEAGNCFGLPSGTNLKQVWEYLCSQTFTRKILTNIATNQTTLNGFCNIVQSCGPSPGSSTPIPSPVVWTIP